MLAFFFSFFVHLITKLWVNNISLIFGYYYLKCNLFSPADAESPFSNSETNSIMSEEVCEKKGYLETSVFDFCDCYASLIMFVFVLAVAVQLGRTRSLVENWERRERCNSSYSATICSSSDPAIRANNLASFPVCFKIWTCFI